MILIKYLVYYSFIGLYETGIFITRTFSKTYTFFTRLNTIKPATSNQKPVLRTTLLRTAFRSIL